MKWEEIVEQFKGEWVLVDVKEVEYTGKIPEELAVVLFVNKNYSFLKNSFDFWKN